VPLEEATQIVERLRSLDRPVTLTVFPDEGHGVVKLANRRRLLPEIVAFLHRTLNA
jgi:dipeptidyl aminopeptidase/acylaminoacyl peptidase